MRWTVLAAALLAACYRPAAADNCTISCASTSDCPDDTMCESGLCTEPGTPCSVDGPFCFGTLASISGCLPAAPVSPLTVTNSNTTVQADCALGVTGAAAAYCVAAFSSIEIAPGSTVTFAAAKPIVLVSAGTITIEGTVDVSKGNAGAHPASCLTETPPTTNAGGGGGGGAGGKGEDGGAGTGAGNVGGPMPPAAPLSGGCNGQSAIAAGGALPGGLGGGAIAVITAQELNLSGSILASGAGGRAGVDDIVIGGGGGAGGGGGGTIVIDGPVTGGGLVIAEGGGGGGGTTADGQLGMDGGTSMIPRGGFGGPGGSGTGTVGGTGGDGGGITMATAGTNGAGGGGGGGGGGPGKIHIQRSSTFVTSPPPS